MSDRGKRGRGLPLGPSLVTSRLLLRPFTPGDAPRVHALLQDPEIAATTLRIPYPYSRAMADEWIAGLADRAGEDYGFALSLREGDLVLGAMGLHPNWEHETAELGYWIGKNYWGQGYATEAGAAVTRFAFEHLRLARVHAYHFSNNPASGAVLRKLGFQHEGTFREHILKGDTRLDLLAFGLLRDAG